MRDDCPLNNYPEPETVENTCGLVPPRPDISSHSHPIDGTLRNLTTAWQVHPGLFRPNQFGGTDVGPNARPAG